MTLQELKYEYDTTFDMVLDQMEKVSALVAMIRKPYHLKERQLQSVMKEMKEENQILKDLNKSCSILDQMIQDKYTVREMYIIQNYKLEIS
jgi:hypothetical protein